MNKNEQLIIDKCLDMYGLSDFGWKSVHIKGNIGEIISSAFKGFDTIENVVLDYGIEHIRDYAFEACKNLVEISLPLSLATIGKSAFSGCLNLKKIHSGLLEKIDDFSFYCCKNLLETPSLTGVKYLGRYAFYSCDSLQSVSINCDISENAFCFCRNLGFLYIYDSCETIGKSSFSYCEKLHHIKFGPNVKCIDDKAFYHCDLRTLNLPTSVMVIGEDAFAANRRYDRCEGHIKELKIPASVRKIGKRAFSGHPIEKLGLSEGLEVIEAGAFEDCLLWEIDLPKTVKEVSPYAFNKNTYVSVDGVPLSAINKIREAKEKKELLDKEIHDIEIEKSDIENLLSKKTEQKKNCEKKVDFARDSLDQINRECVDCKIKYDLVIRQYGSIVNDITAQICEKEKDLSKLKNELDESKNELEKAFFLAISKKKELSKSIEGKKSEIMLLEQNLEELQKGLVEAQEKINTEKNILNVKFDECQVTKNYINETEAEIKKIVELVKNYLLRLDKVKTQLNEKERLRLAVIAENDAMLSENKADWKKEKLIFEKNYILRKIGIPDTKEYKVSVTNSDCKEKNSSFCVQLLQKYVYEHTKEKNETTIASFSKMHHQDIFRLKEINKDLDVNEFDGIEFLFSKSTSDNEFESIDFYRLHYMFSEKFSTAKFNQMKKALSDIEADLTKERDIAKMFSDFNSVVLKGSAPDDYNISVNIVVLPEFLVLFKRTEIKLIPYSDIRVSEKHTEKTQKIKSTSWKLPDDCEVVSKQYLYENSDGTPNKRYKDNPLTVKLRQNKLIVECDTIKIVIKEKTLEQTEKHIELIKNFKAERQHNRELLDIEQLLFSGTYEDIGDFLDVQDRKTKEKQKKKEDALKKQEAELERQRKAYEAEQQALEQEKLKRRYELIQQQKEINESKKADLEDIKPSKKAIQTFFDDGEFEENECSEQMAVDKNVNDCSFSIKEKRNITNSVFKLTFIQNLEIVENEITVYFVDENDRLISNKRKIKPEGKGTEVSVGFILNSGIDFTVMKACRIKIEYSAEKHFYIDFTMNISFYSDF